MKIIIEENYQVYIILLYDHHQQYKEDFHNKLFQISHPKIEEFHLYNLIILFRFTL